MQKLQVHRFRQIEDASIEVTQYLLLIGEQASGKSTIAKLIYFFKSLPQDYLGLLYHSQNQRVETIQSHFIRSIQDKFNRYFGMTGRLPDDFSIKYYYDIEKNAWIELSKKQRLNIQFESFYWSDIATKTRNLLTEIGKHSLPTGEVNFTIQEKRNNSILQKLKSLVSKLFFDKRECLYFPAGRNITVSYPEQFQLLFYGALGSSPLDARAESNTIDLTLMKEFIGYSKVLVDYFSTKSQFINARSNLGRVLAEKVAAILHGSYVNDNGYENINFADDDFVPLKNASSGQQECIRIIQDLIYILNQEMRGSRIIEESETHLYPTAQKLLVELMSLISNKTDSQMILTTHSPFILSTFNNLLYYHKVLMQHPDKAGELADYFGVGSLDSNKGERMDIAPEAFRAYALKPGAEEYCKSIFDAEVKLIGANYIDEASEKVYADFEYLYSLI